MDNTPSGLLVVLKRSLQHTRSQHERLREIHEELDRAFELANAEAVHVWTGRLRTALDAHFRLEQNTLFPLLAELAPATQADIQTLQAEHVAFLRVFEAASAPNSANGIERHLLVKLREQMAAHEALEERIFSEGLAQT